MTTGPGRRVDLAVDVGASEMAVEGFAARETYQRVVKDAIRRANIDDPSGSAFGHRRARAGATVTSPGRRHCSRASNPAPPASPGTCPNLTDQPKRMSPEIATGSGPSPRSGPKASRWPITVAAPGGTAGRPHDKARNRCASIVQLGFCASAGLPSSLPIQRYTS